MLQDVPEELMPLLAERLRALGDAGRLRVMAQLSEGERTIGELVAALGMTQPNVTRHVDRLEQAGWVTRRRDGTRVWVRLADGVSHDLCDCLCRTIRRQAAALAARVGVTPDAMQ